MSPTPVSQNGSNLGAAEREWLESHPLQPVAHYERNTVEIQIYKPPRSQTNPQGFSAEQFRANLDPPQAFKKTAAVEANFEFDHGGRTYFFTAVKFNVAGIEVFTPVITQPRKDWDPAGDGEVGLHWRNLPASEAETLLASAAFLTGLSRTLAAANVATPPNEYLRRVRQNLSDTAVVRGCQTYNVLTGLYTYEQHVESANPIITKFADWLGSTRAIETALKISYAALGEPELAGKKGENGPEQQTCDGKSRHAGP